MVCLACLLPLFLVPIVNILPILFDFIMGKIYRLFGWEYRKPERAPPACAYKPTAHRNNKVDHLKKRSDYRFGGRKQILDVNTRDEGDNSKTPLVLSRMTIDI